MILVIVNGTCLVLPLFCLCSQTKSQDAPVAAGESVVSSVSVAAASDKADGKVSTHTDVTWSSLLIRLQF